MNKLFFLLITLISTLSAANSGRIENGYYTSPKNDIRVWSPVSPSSSTSKSMGYYVINNQPSVELCYEGLWSNQGVWKASTAYYDIALNTTNLINGAAQDLKPMPELAYAKLVYKGQKEIGGKQVYMHYYHGKLGYSNAGYVTCAMLYNQNRLAFFDVVFEITSPENEQDYLERVDSFIGSFEYLK